MNGKDEIKQLAEDNKRLIQQSQKNLQEQYLKLFSHIPQQQEDMAERFKKMDESNKETEAMLSDTKHSINLNAFEEINKLEKKKQFMHSQLDELANLKKQLNTKPVDVPSMTPTFFTPKPVNNNEMPKKNTVSPSFIFKGVVGIGLTVGISLIASGFMTGQLELCMAGGFIAGVFLGILLLMLLANKVSSSKQPVNEPDYYNSPGIGVS